MGDLLADGSLPQKHGAMSSEPALGIPVFRFGRFVVSPGSRSVLHDGRPIELGGRAFDLLVVLLKSRGALVTKRDIVKHVWPSTVVDESNLRFQMASLRKALGEDHREVIKTIPGRGYLFIADVVSHLLESGSTAISSSPQHAISPAGAARPEAAGVAVETREPAQCACVVIIDDDLGVREGLECLLRSAGLSVESFSSVAAYLACPRETPPACLILDIWLPGRSGLDFQSELKTGPAHPPVIFISGNADVAMSVKAMKAGAVEFLTKPVRHEELLDAIAHAIGRATD